MGNTFIFSYVDIQRYQHHLLKRISFPHCVTVVKFKFTVYVGFNSDVSILVYTSVLMPVPYYFNHSSFEICFEIRTCDASSFALLLKKLLAVPGLLWFHMNLRIFKIFL